MRNILDEIMKKEMVKDVESIETINTGGGCIVDFYYDIKNDTAILINEEVCNIIRVNYEELKEEVYDKIVEIKEAWGVSVDVEEKTDIAYLLIDGIGECLPLECAKLINFINLDDEKIEYDCDDMDEKTKLEIIGNLIKINKK